MRCALHQRGCSQISSMRDAKSCPMWLAMDSMYMFQKARRSAITQMRAHTLVCMCADAL